MSTRALIGGGLGVFALGLSLVWFWSTFPDSDLIKLFASAWQPEAANGVNRFALALTGCVFIFTLSLNVTALIISATPPSDSPEDDEIPWLGMIVGPVIGAVIGCFLGNVVGGQVISAPSFIGGLFTGVVGLVVTVLGVLVSLYSLGCMGLFFGLVGAGIIGALAGVNPALTLGVIIGIIAGLLGGMLGHVAGQWIGASLEHDTDWNVRKSKNE
jgi:hypothetical protein